MLLRRSRRTWARSSVIGEANSFRILRAADHRAHEDPPVRSAVSENARVPQAAQDPEPLATRREEAESVGSAGGQIPDP